MSIEFLEAQAKARGMTVSEMMSERSKLVNPKKRGLASNREAAKRASKLGNDKRWGKKLGSSAEG